MPFHGRRSEKPFDLSLHWSFYKHVSVVPSIGIGDGGEVMEVCRFSWCLFMKLNIVKRSFE